MFTAEFPALIVHTEVCQGLHIAYFAESISWQHFCRFLCIFEDFWGLSESGLLWHDPESWDLLVFGKEASPTIFCLGISSGFPTLFFLGVS